MSECHGIVMRMRADRYSKSHVERYMPAQAYLGPGLLLEYKLADGPGFPAF